MVADDGLSRRSQKLLFLLGCTTSRLAIIAMRTTPDLLARLAVFPSAVLLAGFREGEIEGRGLIHCFTTGWHSGFPATYHRGASSDCFLGLA